jgi:Uma2 family endonuclease
VSANPIPAMIQAVQRRLSFDEFVSQYPEDGDRYELRNGVMVAMRPIGPHEEVIAFIRRKIDIEIDRLNLPWFIPQTCLVKADREDSGYLSDIIVLDKAAINDDPYWKKYSSISMGNTVRLIVEVVSTNWQDDYLTKLAEYEKLGVAEYWIFDYRALGGVRYIGSPKMPTIWVYRLVNGEYESAQAFQSTEAIASIAFPGLPLTIDAILQSIQ